MFVHRYTHFPDERIHQAPRPSVAPVRQACSFTKRPRSSVAPVRQACSFTKLPVRRSHLSVKRAHSPSVPVRRSHLSVKRAHSPSAPSVCRTCSLSVLFVRINFFYLKELFFIIKVFLKDCFFYFFKYFLLY